MLKTFNLSLLKQSIKKQGFVSLIIDISYWFNNTFPNITPQQQVKKIREEIAEVNDAPTLEDKRREAVDVFIALCGLGVFYPNNRKLIARILAVITTFNLTPAMIRQKLEINKRRKWAMDANSVPHHTES